MKNIVYLFCTFLAVLSCSGGHSSGTGNPNEFAEFYVADVSTKKEFIDSTSAKAGKVAHLDHIRMDIWIEGELDSGAVIRLLSYPDYITIADFNLAKGEYSLIEEYGKVSLKLKPDYYDGDTLVIWYIPKGATKGHLKIETVN